MKARAAVAWEAKKPLSIEEIEVMGPREGEVLLRTVASGVCHTDAFTLSGDDPEGSFPCVLGHEGGCEVVELGPGVKNLSVGDHVIPLYIPECGECEYCHSPKTNLCQSIAGTVWTGYMPDGTRRFSKNGKDIFHYMGCSTFSEYTVVPEIALARINKAAPLDKVCLLGCGVTTGIGAVLNTAKVEPGSTVAVFGLGGIGLSCIQGAVMAGAERIIAIDINPDKFTFAKQLGATDFVNPNDIDGSFVEYMQDTFNGGPDYSFECIGNTHVMRDALECTHMGWGVSTVIGVAGAGQTIETRPFNLVVGRTWKGTAFGGVKGRTELPGYVDRYMNGKIELDSLVTHTMPLEDINRAFDLMHSGESIRSVIIFKFMKLIESIKESGGYLNRYQHHSSSCNCDMVFSVYLPPQAELNKVPALYWLSGLTCTDDNARSKAGMQRYAAEHGIAIVFPDTSPRGEDVADEADRYDLGQGAGFYVNATQSPWSEHYQMYDYITQELPALVESNLPLLANIKSISGHSMGGHGALICALKNPEDYKSVSAFAPICHPVDSGWGIGCFTAYLGDDKETWKTSDATELVKAGATFADILIDQGTSDEFYDEEQLLPEDFRMACNNAEQSLTLRMQEGYDHSYHFIASFVGEHIAYHAEALKKLIFNSPAG